MQLATHPAAQGASDFAELLTPEHPSISEVYRVLQPGGNCMFLKHGLLCPSWWVATPTTMLWRFRADNPIRQSTFAIPFRSVSALR
jgi:hypothetical protein